MTSYKEYYTAIKKVQYKNQKAKSMSRNKSKLSISLSKDKYYTPSLDHDQMKHVGRMMKNYKSQNDEETRKLRYENPYGNPFFDTVESPIKKHIEQMKPLNRFHSKSAKSLHLKTIVNTVLKQPQSNY
jgi:hypothetical protein